MPVGCLGDATHDGSVTNMDTIVTSSTLNSADQFAFMQQTLLLQIFRVTPTTTSRDGNGHGSPEVQNGDSNSDHGANLNCPTCIAFSDNCCQGESGLQLFQEFQDINLQCYWDAKLSEAIANLR